MLTNRQTINDICTYLIQHRGQVDEAEINKMIPLQMTVERVDTAVTLNSSTIAWNKGQHGGGEWNDAVAPGIVILRNTIHAWNISWQGGTRRDLLMLVTI